MLLPRPLVVLVTVMVMAVISIVLLGTSVLSPPSEQGGDSVLSWTDLELHGDPPLGDADVDDFAAGVVLAAAGEVDVAATAARAADVDAGGLAAGLKAALDKARSAASSHGIELPVASGYRSAEEQAELLAAEVPRRGTLAEGLRWVFPPDRSMHVRGLAIDVNSRPGADWLDVHGAAFGLCKTLAWEWWHFEWREPWEREAVCPAPALTPEDAPGP